MASPLSGFIVFATLRVLSSLLEATDPATLPLIGDWWPVEERARKISIFNAGAAVGTFGGLIMAGVIVDNFGWRWAFFAWLPLALLGAALIRSRAEPERGAQDAVYSETLEEATAGPEHDLVVELVEREAPEIAAEVAAETSGPAATVAAVMRLRSWRLAAIGISVTGVAAAGLGTWGLAYFKRTFGLSSTDAAGLAPLIGGGAFAGVLGGGFLADRMLAVGRLKARVYVTAAGFAGGGVVFALAYTTTNLWVAAPLLAVAATLTALPTGPQFALLMDVTPTPLRSQASAAQRPAGGRRHRRAHRRRPVHPVRREPAPRPALCQSVLSARRPAGLVGPAQLCGGRGPGRRGSQGPRGRRIDHVGFHRDSIPSRYPSGHADHRGRGAWAGSVAALSMRPSSPRARCPLPASGAVLP